MDSEGDGDGKRGVQAKKGRKVSAAQTIARRPSARPRAVAFAAASRAALLVARRKAAAAVLEEAKAAPLTLMVKVDEEDSDGEDDFASDDDYDDDGDSPVKSLVCCCFSCAASHVYCFLRYQPNGRRPRMSSHGYSSSCQSRSAQLLSGCGARDATWARSSSGQL